MNCNSQKVNLVTGGAGFLGSNLIDKLMKNNQKVICLDNFQTGKKSNINRWLDYPNFQYIEHDVTKYIAIDVDKIWHLACPASPAKYQVNPIKTSKTCFLGTYNMLELAKINNAKILLASSSEIYGNPQINPQPETYTGCVNTTGVRSCYEEGKRISETLCSDYRRFHNLQISIIRIFNTFGPKMSPDDGRVISNFIVQCLKGKNLTIYGKGNQTRSFCYVDDLVDGMIKVMDGNYSQPINIGSPVELTILEIANKIRNLINPDLGFIFEHLPEDEPKKRQPDIKKIIEEFNWQPKISIDEGLILTINWFKKNQKFLI